LQPGESLSEAVDEINSVIARIHMPASINGAFAGTGQLFQQSLGKKPILIIERLMSGYSLVAGVGATMAPRPTL